MSMKEELESRCLEIHWPEGFTPVDAGLFAHNEIVIQASSERVWQHIVAATKWPAWYPNAKDVTILKVRQVCSKTAASSRGRPSACR